MNKVEYVLVLIAGWIACMVGLTIEFAGYYLAIKGQPNLALSNAALGAFIIFGAIAVMMLSTIVYNKAAKAATK